MSYLGLINSIVSNPKAHQVDRKRKMADSVDKAIDNINIRRKKQNEADIINDVDYGYGKNNGRGQGD